MGVVELLVVGVVGIGVAVGAIAAFVGRDRRRRNQVVPGTETGAPAAWAGAHTPEARLHRRLRDAVAGMRAIDDPDGSLIAARVEVERAALATDRHLVALDAMAERERAGRLPAARGAVAAVESAAAAVADLGGAGRSVIATAAPGPLPAVSAATERVSLLAEAFAELDEVDATATPPPRPGPRVVVQEDDTSATSSADDDGGRASGHDEDGRGSPMPG